jgi:4-amino-4-deoxy-L-arabinose transferase-like glycosyltransferase
MSRTSLLDMTLMFFVLVGLYSLLKENFWAAGLLFGFAFATKWSAVYYIAFFGIYFLVRNLSRIRKNKENDEGGVQNHLKVTTLLTAQLAVLPLFV